MSDSRQFCEFDYIDHPSPTARTVLSTLAIIFLSILLEIIVNVRLDGCSTTESNLASAPPKATLTPISTQPHPEPQPTASAQQDADPAPPSGAKRASFCCPKSVSPHVRANRLAAAILIFIPLLAVFSLRMTDVVTPYIRPGCRRYFGSGNVPPENMWAVAFLNIVPFVSACFAVLRALVDVVLVRWGRGLSYEGDGKGVAWCPWMPCMPFFAFMVLGCTVWMCVRWPVAALMGRSGSSLWEDGGRERGDDVEMQGEQVRNLLDDMDEDGDETERGESAVGLPSYDEVVRPSNKL